MNEQDQPVNRAAAASETEPAWIIPKADGTVEMAHLKCAALRLRKASRRVTQIYDAALAAVGLTITQYGVLVHTRMHPGSTVGQLADILFTDPTTLTRVLKPLIERAVVTLDADSHDRRVRQVHITDAGRRLLREAYPLWLQAQTAMREKVGDDTFASLIGILDQSLDKLADL